jgi:hypothetical protein
MTLATAWISETRRMEAQQPWHRLFGLTWMDFFTGLPITVEMEKDLSLKKQLLDVLLIRKDVEILAIRLHDGFEDLGRYNLVTFKSHMEKLSIWTLLELVGHYFNLRKQVGPAMDEDQLLPQEQFRLFAVCARYPQQLAGHLGPALQPIMAGVYEANVLGLRIRVVVPNQLPAEEHIALLHLFSMRAELLFYAYRNYHVHFRDASSLLLHLFRRAGGEIEAMANALQELARQTIAELLKEMPIEKRLEGLSAEQLLKAVPAILKAVPVEKLLERLSPEQRVEGLSPEQLIQLAKKRKGNSAAGATEDHPPQ